MSTTFSTTIEPPASSPVVPSETIRPEDIDSVLILDPDDCAKLIEERREIGADRFDEVWEGQYMMAPNAGWVHQELASELGFILHQIAKELGGYCHQGDNVTDREKNWTKNFRVPDVLVVLPGSKAKKFEGGLIGGPDFVVEILSPGERPLEKLPFYAKVGTREVLHVDRDTKALALYRLESDAMSLVGTADSAAAASQLLTSAVVPLSFHVLPGKDSGATVLVVQHTADKREWRIGA